MTPNERNARPRKTRSRARRPIPAIGKSTRLELLGRIADADEMRVEVVERFELPEQPLRLRASDR